MSAEQLKHRLIPLIRAGYRDDVRCLMLIHLKENPDDEDVWSWYVGAAEDKEARRRAVEKWLQVNPHSRQAQRMLERLIRERAPERRVYASHAPTAAQPRSAEAPRMDGPFSAKEFIKAIFIGQKRVVDALAPRVEAIKGGRNLNLLLEAPAGWGKTLLATLILEYLDPHGRHSAIALAASSDPARPFHASRFHLIEDVDRFPDPEQLIPFMKTGAHTFLFTSRGRVPMPESFLRHTRVFEFEPYSHVDLGLIAYETLYQHGIEIATKSMLQIARYCRGSPREAVSYAERLALLWSGGTSGEGHGELIFLLNNTLKNRPDDSSKNYLAIWKDRFHYGIGVSEVIDDLETAGFPFGLNFTVAPRELQSLPPEQRRAFVAGQIIQLPPFVFQTRFNPAGPLAPTLSSSRSEGLILGAYSELELRRLVALCGFNFVRNNGDSAPSMTKGAIADEVLKAVWARDQGRCVRCGTRERLEFDYIIPPDRGGSSTTRNLQVLCETCAGSKAARLDEYA